MALNLPLAVGMIDIVVNTRQFDQQIAYIRAKLSTTPSVHNIGINVNRAQATATINLLMQQLQAMRAQAGAPIPVAFKPRGGFGGARGGGGGGAGLGMGLMQGLGVAGFAMNPAMMAGQMIGAGLHEAVGTAMDLEQTFVGLRRVTGESAANVDKFKKSIFDISKSQAGVSVKDLTDIAMAGAKAGVTDKEGLGGLETFTRGMAAVRNSVQGIGTEQLADSMTQMLNLFSKGTDYVQSFGSVLARMDNVSTASASSILDMSKSLSGTFASLGLSIPDVMAFSSILADSGLTAQQGASSFSQILRMIASDTNKFAGAIGMPLEQFQAAVKGDALTALKLVIDKFQEINNVDTIKAQEFIVSLGFKGVKTAGAFQQVAANMDKLSERRQMAVEEETNLGSLTAANALNSETAIANIQKLKNAFTELADAVGKVAIGPLTESVKTLMVLINQMAGGKEGGPKRLGFMEEVELRFMNMVASLGGEVSPEFEARRNDLNQRAEAFAAAASDLPLEAGPVKPEDLKKGPEGQLAPAAAHAQAMIDAAIPRDLVAQPLAGVGEEMARANDVAQANLMPAPRPFRGRGGTTFAIQDTERALKAQVDIERSARATANARGQDDAGLKATKAALAAAIQERQVLQQSLREMRSASQRPGAALGLGAAGLTVGPGLLEKAKTSNIFDLIGQAQGLGDAGPGLLEKMAKGSSWPIPLKSPTDAAAAALAARVAVPKDREHIGVAISGEEMLKRFQEGALKGKDDIGAKQLAVQEKTLTAVEMLAEATKAGAGGGIARLE